jgi:hypothetical protein
MTSTTALWRALPWRMRLALRLDRPPLTYSARARLLRWGNRAMG